jgi:succinoglycan biosynthesis transport protein ExoP
MSPIDPVQAGFPAALPAPAPGPALVPARVLPPVGQAISSVPPVLSAAPTALALLKALRRCWLLALSLGSLCLLVVGPTTWYLVPPSKYQARAMFLVSSVPPQIIFKTSEARADFATYQQTQVTLITSQLVLNHALRQPGVANLGIVKTQANPVAWLEKEIRIDRSGEILRISMSGTRPDEVATLVNAVAGAYKEKVVDAEHLERADRLKELEVLYSEYQTKLRTRRETVKRLVESLGSSDKETRTLTHQYSIERLAMAEKELMQLQSELRRAQVELTVLNRSAGRVVPVAMLDSVIETSLDRAPQIERDTAEVNRINRQLAMLHVRVRKPSDPTFRQAQTDLQTAQRALADHRAQLRPWIEQQLRVGAIAGSASTPELLGNKIETLTELVAVTQKEVESLAQQARSFNSSSQDLESLQDELAHADSAAKRIGDEVEALKVELNAPSRVRQIEVAETPRREDETKQIKLAATAGFGSFAFALLGVSWYEFRARRIDSAEEVVQGLGLRIVGTLPTLPERARRRRSGSLGTRSSPWQRLLIESIDATRTMLLHLAHAEKDRVVMISSALGGEGKTSLSSQLAISLARAGLKTLLLDCDLRSPAAHRLFDLPAGPGFCELLRGEVDLADAIRPTAVSGLWMITAGVGDGQAIRGLAQANVRGIFDRLRDQFDFILVDSSPILPVADSLLISQHVDVVIFSILRNVSRITKVYAAAARLSALGVRLLGVVVTGTHGDLYGMEYSG